MERDEKTCFSIWRENLFHKDSLFVPKGMAEQVRINTVGVSKFYQPLQICRLLS